MLQPTLPDYDIPTWRALPFSDRLRLTCQSWAVQGYGTPTGIFFVYALKIFVYIAGWVLFCSFTEGLDLTASATWWATPTAFLKAILWTLLFEGLGFGCGSGPLTGRYAPPLAGFLYFLRPGTLKAPLFEGAPVIGADHRGVLDISLYVLQIGLLLTALCAPSMSVGLLWAIVLNTALLGCCDKTVFLAFRPEHYLSVLVCFLLSGDWVVGSKWVWLAIWWWAATSKLNRHFPVVMCVMVSNSPWTRFVPGLRAAMYRSVPHDLRPSRFAHGLAHTGTAVELLFPLVLIVSPSGPVLWTALVVMAMFHLFILSNVPMGVPLEWNVMMVYGGCALFGVEAEVSMFQMSVPLLLWLVSVHFLLPLYGSIRPDRVSFLMSMRYYAGNWAYSVWLFQPGCDERLDSCLVKSSALVHKQLALMYDEDTITALLSKVVAFRMMHLHGRALLQLLPLAVDDLEDRTWMDGEILAGLCLGWNFGDGHLHGPGLLRAIQRRCQFEPGQLRCVFVESEPMFGGDLQWQIFDAAEGEVETGSIEVSPLMDLQPWGESAPN